MVKGDAGTKRDVELQKNATVTGNVTSAGKLKLDATATVGGTITLGPIAIPLLPRNPLLPTAMPFTAGGLSVTTGRSETTTLEPGVYGELKLDKENTLHVSSGKYFFDKISADKDLDLHFDVAAGAIDIFVAGDAKFKQRLDVFVNGVSSLATWPGCPLVTVAGFRSREIHRMGNRGMWSQFAPDT